MTDISDTGTAVFKPSTKTDNVSPLWGNDIAKAATNIDMLRLKEVTATVDNYVTSPFDTPTPKEKVKKRPDGFDYIESSWMDYQFKSHSPLYSYDLVHYSESHGWITCIIRLTDRVTGNSELGGASVRIQVKKGAGEEPTFRDIIDKGNNVAAVVTRACKNAQSRFGHGADVYRKREAAQTIEEKERYDSLYTLIKTEHSSARAQQFEQGWNELGADFSEYLDKWENYMIKYSKSSAEKNNNSTGSDTAVTEDKSQSKTKSKVII